MHFPKVVISLFMRFASSKRFPLDSVFDTRSLPAKSTIFSIPLTYFVSPPSFHLWSTAIWITAWLRDDRLFSITASVLLPSTRFFLFVLLFGRKKTTTQQSSLISQSDPEHGYPLRYSILSKVFFHFRPKGRRYSPGKILQN